MKKRKFIATGSLVTALLLTGATQSFAQTVPAMTQTATSRLEYDTTETPELSGFGVEADDQLNDSQLDDMSLQILVDEGFSPAQIHKIFITSNNLRQGKV